MRKVSLMFHLQSATKWVETLRPKLGYFFFKRRKYSFSSPIPYMQHCADVRATYRKQQTPHLWMEGQGRDEDSFALWSYPIWVRCLNDFVANCKLKVEVLWIVNCESIWSLLTEEQARKTFVSAVLICGNFFLPSSSFHYCHSPFPLVLSLSLQCIKLIST